MPNGVLPNEGIGAQLEYILRAPIAGVLPWELILWVNDVPGDADTMLADLVEATWSGYHPITLSRSGWTVPSVEAGCATSTWGVEPYQWTVTGGPLETVYGYAMVDESSGLVRYVQRFDDDDIEQVQLGQVVQLLPTYTLTSAACGVMTSAARRRTATARRGKRNG